MLFSQFSHCPRFPQGPEGAPVQNANELEHRGLAHEPLIKTCAIMSSVHIHLLPHGKQEDGRLDVSCTGHLSILECKVLQYLSQSNITVWTSEQDKWVWMQIVRMNSFTESKLGERYRKSGSSCRIYVSNARALMRSWKKALSHLWGLHGMWPHCPTHCRCH